MKFIFTGCYPHQPEVWLWNHEQRQEGPESLRDGEDDAHQQPSTCLCLRLRDNLETIFDSTGLNWLGPPIMGKNTHNLKTTLVFAGRISPMGKKTQIIIIHE